MSRFATPLALLLLLAAPPALTGQNPEPEPDVVAGPVAVSEKSAFAAGAIEWFVPTGGYAYAGDWARGIPPALLRVVGLALFVQGYELGIFSESSCDGSCTAGILLATAGTVWGIAGAAATARRTNERLREEARSRVSITPVRGPDGTGVRIGMRIPTGR